MRRHDRNDGVRAFVDGAQGWRGLLVVNISGVLEEDLLEAGEGDLRDRDGASVEDPSVDLFYEGLCRRPAGDQDLLPLRCLDRVVDQDPRQLLQTLVSHRIRSSSRSCEQFGELIICSQRGLARSASASELQRPAHLRQYGVGVRGSEGPGLELQADDARVVAVRQSGEERPQGSRPLPGRRCWSPPVRSESERWTCWSWFASVEYARIRSTLLAPTWLVSRVTSPRPRRCSGR